MQSHPLRFRLRRELLRHHIDLLERRINRVLLSPGVVLVRGDEGAVAQIPAELSAFLLASVTSELMPRRPR